MKVVAFNGSPREDGNTSMLLNMVLQALQREGIETELVQLGGANIRGCTACYKCRENRNRRCSVEEDQGNFFIEKLLSADGVLLGSPTYFADVTAEMKALMDRGGLVARVNGGLLRRKVGAAVVAARRGGAIHAFDTLNHFFLIAEMIVPGSSYWNLAYGYDKGDVELDAEGARTMEALGANMAWVMKKLQE
jgi:multimeric flavodoxin WrbA